MFPTLLLQDATPPHYTLVRIKGINLQLAQASKVNSALSTIDGLAPSTLDSLSNGWDVILLS